MASNLTSYSPFSFLLSILFIFSLNRILMLFSLFRLCISIHENFYWINLSPIPKRSQLNRNSNPSLTPIMKRILLYHVYNKKTLFTYSMPCINMKNAFQIFHSWDVSWRSASINFIEWWCRDFQNCVIKVVESILLNVSEIYYLTFWFILF